jgi:AcrR family transcriptional regulator
VKINERIINACQELARSRGLHNFTMDELSAHAGLSKRTVYRYFRSKEDIIEAAVDSFLDGAAAEVDSLIYSEKDPLEVLSNMFNYIFAHGQFLFMSPALDDLRKYYPHLWQKIDHFRIQRIKTVIEMLKSQNHIQAMTDIDPRILIAVITASVQAVLNPDFILENGLTFEETAGQLSKLIENLFIKNS